MADQVFFGVDSRHRPMPCPYCGKMVDAATLVASKPRDGAPKVGDFTVCLYCAKVARFGAGLKLARPAGAEMAEFMVGQPKEFELLMRVVAAARLRIFADRIDKHRRN